MVYPSTFSSFNRPAPTDRLSSPSHSALHNTVSSAVGQIEQFIGLSTSSAVGSLVYDVRSPDSNGGGHVQTVNKGGTGQTSYNKGDILIATSSSVLAKLAVGTDGQILTANSGVAAGASWGAGGAPVVRTYATSLMGYSVVSTWVRPSNLAYVVVEGIAGGGGSNGRGGGGAGGYFRKTFNAPCILASQTIKVGEGNPSNNDGGTTIFGSILLAQGGLGTNAATGGIGGSVVGGDLNIFGGKGENGDASESISGNGGTGYFGGSGGSANPSVLGAWGAGSEGLASMGQNGIVIVTEY